ncbi:MAG: hypothetical protein JWO56_1092 [Acidobacteria bacterium]|nr:hypothetical protein [Acidobacteriota bacterium]
MMDDNTLRLPTVPLAAEIRYFDERPMRGRIFLPAAAQRHGGPMLPDEWMNQTTLFFPFLPDEGHTLILNKRYVVVLSVALGGIPFTVDDEEGALPKRVLVQCGTLELSGLIYVTGPETQLRVLDFVNRGEPFLSLHDGERRHLIQKNRITTIAEIAED